MANTVIGYSQWFLGAIGKLADEMQESFRKTGCAPLSIWYKRNGLMFAAAPVGEKPDGFEPALGGVFRGNHTREQLVARLHLILSGVPVLPGDS